MPLTSKQKNKTNLLSFQNIMRIIKAEIVTLETAVEYFICIFGNNAEPDDIYAPMEKAQNMVSLNKKALQKSLLSAFTVRFFGDHTQTAQLITGCTEKLKDQFLIENSDVALKKIKTVLDNNIIHLEHDEYHNERLSLLRTLCKLYDRMLQNKKLHNELLIYLMIGSLYNCRYVSDARSFIAYLESYGTGVTYSYIDTLMEFAKSQLEFAKTSASRLVPYSLTEHMIELPTLHNATISNRENETSLYHLVTNCDKNVMVTGAGGSGKTFTLIELVDRCLSTLNSTESATKILPIYIPLNTVTSTGSEPVMEYISRKMALLTGETDTVQQLVSWLKSTDNVKLVFLLDGFNEVTSSELQTAISNEVKTLIGMYSDKLKFVVTSRYDMSSTFTNGSTINNSFLSYAVDDLKDNTIHDYIEKFLCDSPKQTINKAIRQTYITGTHEIKPVLKKPMALVMYCFIYKKLRGVSFDSHKIPHKDFNKLGEIIENYVSLLKEVHKTESGRNHIEDFIGYLAFRMSFDGYFAIGLNRLESYLREHNRIKLESILGVAESPVGIDLSAAGILTVEDIINSHFANDVLVRHTDSSETGTVNFAHQNYRDYFASAFLKRVLSLDTDKINDYFGSDRKLPIEVLALLGDILEEYRYTDSDGSKIQDVMYRYGNQLSPMTVSELIQVCVIARDKDLHNFDFSGLDLSSTKLNGIKLYRYDDNGKIINARFTNTIVPQNAIDSQGHAGAVYAFVFLEERYIISFSKYTIYCFDMVLRNQYKVADYSEYAINDCCHIPDTQLLITGDDNGVLVIWKYSVNNDKITLEKQYEANRDIIFPSDTDRNYSRSCVEDILFFEGKLWYSAYTDKEGALFCCELDKEMPCLSGHKCISVLDGGEDNGWRHMRNCRQCRISATKEKLYIAFGQQLRMVSVQDVITVEDICFTDSTLPDEAFVYDLAAVTFNQNDVVLLNCNCITDYGIETRVFAITHDESAQAFAKKHTSSFAGYRRFTEFSGADGYTVFLTAMMSNSGSDAGLLKMSLSNNDDGLCVSAMEFPGNMHAMDINCALPFVFSGKRYIATGGLDRMVEILYIEGTENALIYRLPGHTDGIRYIDVLDTDTICSSHYSGEVCVWHRDDTEWRCTHVNAAHSGWVIQTKLIRINGRDLLVSCSYDRTISVIDAENETLLCRITEPLSGILSFGILNDGWIFAGYNYMEDGKLKHCIQKFRIDAKNNSYTAGKTIEYPTRICLVGNHGNGTIVAFESNDSNGTNVYFTNSTAPARLKETLLNDRLCTNVDFRVNAAERIRLEDGTVVSVCAGTSHNDGFRLKLWYNNGTDILEHNITDIAEIGYCYTITPVFYDGSLYIVAGTSDRKLVTLRINNDEPFTLCSVREFSDRVLCVKSHDYNIYISLLNGEVYGSTIEKLINTQCNSTDPCELLFRAVTGFCYCGVDFSLRDKNSCDWSDDFKKLIGYYAKI